MSYDTSDPQVVRKKKRKFELDHEQSIEEFRHVLDTREGRAVIWRILELCGVFKQSYTGNPEDTFFNEGKRKVGLEIRLMFEELGPSHGTKMFEMMTSEAVHRQAELEENNA